MLNFYLPSMNWYTLYLKKFVFNEPKLPWLKNTIPSFLVLAIHNQEKTKAGTLVTNSYLTTLHYSEWHQERYNNKNTVFCSRAQPVLRCHELGSPGLKHPCLHKITEHYNIMYSKLETLAAIWTCASFIAVTFLRQKWDLFILTYGEPLSKLLQLCQSSEKNNTSRAPAFFSLAVFSSAMVHTSMCLFVCLYIEVAERLLKDKVEPRCRHRRLSSENHFGNFEAHWSTWGFLYLIPLRKYRTFWRKFVGN